MTPKVKYNSCYQHFLELVTFHNSRIKSQAPLVVKVKYLYLINFHVPKAITRNQSRVLGITS
jgi:hypothetical protein